MSLFANASPEYLLLGANDKSTRALPVERDAVPQHVPMIFTFAQKGGLDKFLATGAGSIAKYGAETFNPDGPYFKHTTRLAKDMYGEANACMHKRLIPTDAGAPASAVLYIDVLQASEALTIRDAQGAPTGNLAATESNVINFSYVVEEMPTGVIGTAVTKPGYLAGTDAAGNAVTSTLYPIMEFKAVAPGAYYNNIGFSIESLLSDAIDPNIASLYKALTYKLALHTRTGPNAAPTVMSSLFGETSVLCSLKAGVKDPVTGLKKDITSVFKDNWFNEIDPLKPIVYNDYEDIHVYDANIDLSLIHI